MCKKPIILVFARYYLPGFRAGGPIRSIANQVERLSQYFDFRIVALDRDLGAEEPYSSAADGVWTRVGSAKVLYVRPNIGLCKLRKIMIATPHDLLYLNSFFDPRFTLLPLFINRYRRSLRCPVVVAPRGECSQGALGLRRLRKMIFLWLTRLVSLYDSVTWQASSVHEAADIKRVLYLFKSRGINKGVCVASDIATVANRTDPNAAPERFNLATRDGSQGLRICFLSRISPMKNLEFALETLYRVKVPVIFTIYGPSEDEVYWAQCRALISQMPRHIRVTYSGPVDHENVVRTIASYDLFFLPTRGENYGHVIHEALRAGVPILISDRTPWRHLEANGAGWALSLDDVGAFVAAIELAASWSPQERQVRSANALKLGMEVSDDQENIEANRRLFLNVIESALKLQR